MAMQTKTKLRYDKFVNEYIKNQNATQAAIVAGFSKKTAAVKGSELLRNEYIKNRLDEHRQILMENDIADEKEVLSYLSSVMRGNEKDEVATPTGVYEIKVQTKDRNKAAELIGKSYAIWTDKKSIDANIAPVRIIDDVPNNDEGDDSDA